MRKYYSVPLLFFLLAALLGLFLRWQFVEPTAGVRFTFFVHGHSHVMFLGWVFNVLYLASIEEYIDMSLRRYYLKFFVLLQLLVIAMMISFPIQGYGAFSIAFSTAHTLAVMVFIPMFFKHQKPSRTTSQWFLNAAWIFFFASTLGPFSLGYLMATGMGGSVWNNFSIYYYLHFQYNGFFLFGILSLFFRFLEQQGIPMDHVRLKALGWWIAGASVPTYFLSVLFAKPADIFYWLGGAGAVVQLLAFLLVGRDILRRRGHLKVGIRRTVTLPGYLVLLALAIKLMLQLASAHPDVAEVAFSMRPVIIAYLHLVLVGIITLFLLCWYIQRDFMDQKFAVAGLIALLTGFGGSQLALVLVAWWSSTALKDLSSATLIFAFSAFMALSAVLFVVAFLVKRKTATITPSGERIKPPSGHHSAAVS